MKQKDLKSQVNTLARPLLVILFLSILGAAGCSKQISGPAKMVPLTLKSQASGVSPVRALRAATAASADSDSSHVVFSFTRALLVVRDVRFKTAFEGDEEDTLGEHEADGDTLGEHEADDENGIVFRGPFVIDLLSHHSDVLDTRLVPPGVYAKVMGHLQPLHVGDPAATPDLSFLIGSTIFLEGTISGDGGGPFTYQARIDDEFIIHGTFTVASDNPATAFLVFDLNQMLVDREGHFLDPRDPDNDKWIRQAIRHAIKIGMDKDHDGEFDGDDGPAHDEDGNDAPPLAGF
jgi:hypothetical protein